MRSFFALLLIASAAGACTEAPRFQLVEDSGITFANQVEDTPELNIIDYLYYYDGGGVAVGDVNGDGLPDLYFSASLLPNRLYLNQGRLRFEDVTEEAGVAGSSDWNTGVTMADVDGDGLLDIYVCAVAGFRGLRGRNELFMNNGDGTFSERAAEFGLDFSGFGTQASFLDFDLDGDLDVYLLNHSVHDIGMYQSALARDVRHPRAGDRLYRNDGGRFVDVSSEAGIYGGPVGYGLGVSVSDVNLDGFPDIYVANDFQENDYLYLNDGDGTFTESIRNAVGHTSRSSMGSDAADFNNDGLPDVVVLDMLPDREHVLKTSAGIRGHSSLDQGYHFQYMHNSLLLNRGAGRFSNIGMLAKIEATDWSWAGLFCDLDNDGWKDLFVTNGIWRRPNDEDYISVVSRLSAQDSMRSDPEAVLDYVSKMPHVPVSNYAFRNNADLTFEDRTEDWGLERPFFSNGAAYADLDVDGDLDLVVNNLNETAAVYENTGGGNSLSVTLVGPAGNTRGVGTKVFLWAGGILQFQELFPSRGFQSSVDYPLHFGLGRETMVDSLLAVWPDRSYQVMKSITANRRISLDHAGASGGFDYDRLGLTEATSQHLFSDVTDSLALPFRHDENSFAEFGREPLIPHRLSAEGPALAIGDVNGDGLEDLFAGGAGRQPGTLLLQSGDGGFVESENSVWQVDSLYEDVDAAFFDVDQDDDLDLYVVSAGNESGGEAESLLDRLYINDGAAGFTRGELPEDSENGSVVRPADFDADGDIDLFVGGRVVAGSYGRTPRSILLSNRGSTFVDVTPPELRNVGMVTDAVWLDYDGDGLLDLAVVGEWMAPVVFRRTENGFAMEEAGLSGLKGWWTAIEAADLNGDGAIDLILGNLGLNSRLRASPNEPVRLYVDDFDADGEDDHLLTSYRHGTSYPLASRDDLLMAFPSLARKYPSYASYGAGRPEDLFSFSQLRSAQVLEATSFASVVAINTRDGSFEVRVLPIQTQFSPIHAVLAEDFDDDGITDLIVAGNFFGAAPFRGRYDASYGSFLKGDGRGGFLAVEPRVSGLWFEGEIRNLRVLLDARGRRLIVAARNDDRLQLFRVND
ncbi:MAG: VCBS repeat-containing protein [Rhodothermales bacterium]